MEWISLLGLTLLTSHGAIFKFHEVFVGSWLCSSVIHMLTSTYLESKLCRKTTLIKFRHVLTFSTIVCEILMVYLYYRHNSNCEPYIYSYFCLVEYSVIIMNMIYHNIAPPLVNYPVKMIKSCTRHYKNEITSLVSNIKNKFDAQKSDHTTNLLCDCVFPTKSLRLNTSACSNLKTTT